MAFVGYEQVAVSDTVLDVDDLTIPAKTQWAALQADTAGVRYTLDGTTAPTTSSGMVLLTTSDPIDIPIDDLRKIKFIRSGGSDAKLNIHYAAGRDV